MFAQRLASVSGSATLKAAAEAGDGADVTTGPDDTTGDAGGTPRPN